VRTASCGIGHVDEVAAAEAEGGATVADRLHKNVKVWSLYLDLEESLGTVDSCRTAYDRAIDLKVGISFSTSITAVIISYLTLLNFELRKRLNMWILI
jgi:hypothetical protein